MWFWFNRQTSRKSKAFSTLGSFCPATEVTTPFRIWYSGEKLYSMPIHLDPISRRRFIARALTAGAGLAVAPQLFAKQKQTDPNVWALLSDTHIAANPAKVFLGARMAGHLELIGREIIASPQRPTGLLVCCPLNA